MSAGNAERLRGRPGRVLRRMATVGPTTSPALLHARRAARALADDPWRTLTSLPALAAALVFVQLGMRGWALFGSWFWQDDFVYTNLARRQPWLDFVTSDYHGHLQVGQFLVVDVLADVAPLNWPAHAAVVLGLQLVADLLFLAVCLELFGARRAVLVPLTVYLFCPLTLAPLLWWAAALQALPLQIALLVLVLCHARMVRQHGDDLAVRRLRRVAAATFAVGLLFWEKTALVLLIVVLVELLWLREGPFRRRLAQTVRGGGWLWVAYAVSLAAYAILYAAVVEPRSSVPTSVADVLRLLRETVATTFVPGLFGGPWRGNDTLQTLSPPAPHPWDWIAWQAGLAVLIASLWVGGRRAVRAWSVPLVVLLVDIAAVAGTRISFIGPVIGRDGRYISDVVPLVALALGVAFFGPVRPGRTAGPERPGPAPPAAWVRTGALFAVLVFYVNSAWITSYEAALDRHDSTAKRWVTTARQDLAEHPYATVFDAPVPREVVAPVLRGAARASRVLGSLPEGRGRFNRTTDRLTVLDGGGHLRDAELVVSARADEGPSPSCGWRVAGRTLDIPFARTVKASDWVVRIGYYTRTGASARFDLGDRRLSVQVPPGLDFLYVFPEGELSALRITGVDADTPVCVTDVSVGRAWPGER